MAFRETLKKVRTLSSPHEKRYGWRGDTASPRTVEICPVSDSRSSPDARFQDLMMRSPAPVASCEPLVARLDSNAVYLTQVSRNVMHELPWCMICRLDGVCRFE